MLENKRNHYLGRKQEMLRGTKKGIRTEYNNMYYLCENATVKAITLYGVMELSHLGMIWL